MILKIEYPLKIQRLFYFKQMERLVKLALNKNLREHDRVLSPQAALIRVK